MGLRSAVGSLLLGLVLAGSLRAQALAMRHFDSRDGIPQSQVSALLEDRHGFIWASTADGLVRLGPNGAQVFDNTTGFPAKDVSALLEDGEGAIWAGTEEKGLTRLRGREVTVFGAAQGLTDPNIHCLVVTRGGELYAGSQHGLFRRRGERFEPVPLPEPWASGPIVALAEDAQGALYFSNRKGALARWNGTRLDLAELPPAAQASNVNKLHRDPGGALWALQPQRLLKRGADGVWAVVDLPGLAPGAVLNNLSFDRQGELILVLGTDGLYLRQPNGSHQMLNARDLLCRDSLNCALRDRNGGLWLGTDGDYLWTQAMPGLRTLVRNPDTGVDLGLGTVTAFLERPGQRMLIGSNNGVFLWAPDQGVIQHWSRGRDLVSQDVWVLHEDGDQGAWVGTVKGLYRLGPGGRLLPGPKELAQVHVQSMIRHGGRLWVGTDKGIMELDARGQFLASHDPVEQAGYPAVHCLLPWGEDILAGTSEGLLLFRQGTFRRAFADDPTRKLQILSMHQDPRQRLWVGTSQNLLVRDPRTGAWSTLGLEAGGQALYSVTWIRSLANGTVAVGHSKGITLLSADGRQGQLTRRMGLISDETNQGGALADQHGRLWVGMVGGVSLLDELKAFPALAPPRPVIMDVTWERGHFWMPGEVALPPGFAALSVHVDAGLPSTPFPVRYQVRMEEAGGPWRTLEPGLGRIHFEGLSLGTHRLRFRAGFNGSLWTESAPLYLTIRPAWYQTVWAKGLLALTLALTAFVLLRLRLGHLQQLNRELESRVHARTRELEGRTQELAQQNQSLEWTHAQLKETLTSRMGMINTVSHDLRSPLTSILLSVERLQDVPEELSPKAARILGILGHEAVRLDAIVKALLDRNRAESLAERLERQPAQAGAILEDLEDTLELKAEARGLRAHLFVEPASLEASLLLDVAAMKQVLFNLVENALKFTDMPGDVGVRSTLTARDWVLEVWDTGRGIPKAECESLFNPFQQSQAQDARKGWGLGLFICRSIVVAHGGTIAVDSDTGKGAIFRVTIPLLQPQDAVLGEAAAEA